MDKDENLSVRERLFEILDKFMYGRPKTSDFQEFLEIMVYDAPYKNNIVFKTKREDLKIEITKLKGYADGDYEDRVIFFDKRALFNPLLNSLSILGHEYTHYLQDLANRADKKAGGLALHKNLQQIMYSTDLTGKGEQVLDFLKKRKYLNPPKNKRAIQDLTETLYLLLPEEENARRCSFEYTKQMIEALKNDELCPDDAHAYLTGLEDTLRLQWNNEVQNFTKFYYKLRNTYFKAVDELETLPYDEIKKASKDPEYQQMLIYGKMTAIRKKGVSKEQYVKELFNSYAIFYDFNEYKEINKDLKGNTLHYLTSDKEVGIDELILLLDYIRCNNSWKEDKQPFVEYSDIPSLCIGLAQNGNAKALQPFLKGLYDIAFTGNAKEDKISKEMKKYISKKDCRNIYITLCQDDRIHNALEKEMAILAKKHQLNIEKSDGTAKPQSMVSDKLDRQIRQTTELVDQANLQLLKQADLLIEKGRTFLDKTLHKNSVQNFENA